MIEIRPIQQNQIEQAKQIVIAVCLEIWQDILTEQDLMRYDSMSDLEQVPASYNKGLSQAPGFCLFPNQARSGANTYSTFFCRVDRHSLPSPISPFTRSMLVFC